MTAKDAIASLTEAVSNLLHLVDDNVEQTGENRRRIIIDIRSRVAEIQHRLGHDGEEITLNES